MFDTQKIKQAFGAAATCYDQYAGLQYEILGECIDVAKVCWNSGYNILDVGAGTGALAQIVKKDALGWNVTSLDLSFDMCAVASANKMSANKMSVVNGDAQSLPFADDCFDGIFSSLMLQWSNNPLQLFKEWFRVVRPGGRCVFSTFIHGTLDELRESFATLDGNQHVNDFGPPNYFSALTVHAGFRVLSSEEVTITEYYPDAISLMRGLKAIGATTKQDGNLNKGLTTPRQIKALEKAYKKKFHHKDGLPASWQVMYMLLEKP